MTRDKIPLLSKSRFGAGLQCHKRLFLECYSPKLADPIDPGQQAIFESGTAVGELARERFPGGRLIEEEYFRHDDALAATREVIADRSVPAIYEAAFTFDGIRVRVDILVRRRGGAFDLVEVKSSTGVHEQHIPDVAIQLYVVEGAGIGIRRAFLLHIDSDYVYEGGPYDVYRLFRLEDVTKEARAFARRPMPVALAEMREALRQEDQPPIEIGRHCTRPYKCEFYEHCREGVPDHHIEQLPRASAGLLDELLEAGIRDIGDIPAEFPGLSALQQRVRDCVAAGQPYVDPELRAALQEVTYPLHFLDFETFNPALPIYPGTRPYQVIPFQWSLHVRDRAGDLSHHSFLADGDGDPREGFAASLLDAIGPEGTIIAYSSYEQTIIKQLAGDLPQYAERLLDLNTRFLDLLEVLRAYYYHPDFHGSYSIKAVLPALVPDAGYQDLGIQDGSQASLTFTQIIAPETGEDERKGLREALLAYCQRDTEAMVWIFDALR
ncbi:MAG: DUF2779 domain-containing protein [Chloroflexi bacterium]|nr:DUF2779 domain-containing protein [Chloroflexota bacterium]